MKKLKNMFSIVLSLTIFFSVSSSVFAEEQTDADVYESEGLQKIVLTSDEVVYYEIDEVDVTNPNARGSYKSKTATGRFYLTSSGSTVAEYSLSVTFYYDGKRVLESGNRAWMGNYAKGWSGAAVSGWDWISNSYMCVSGYFTLYKDSVYNNSHILTMYCDQNGKITVN